MPVTDNFVFLSIHDARLVQRAALAERYFRQDPATAIFKLRQFAELISKLVAAHHAIYRGEREINDIRNLPSSMSCWRTTCVAHCRW
jgi:type I restriction enzyme R subunit